VLAYVLLVKEGMSALLWVVEEGKKEERRKRP
jgi:hypothetical protein